MTNRTLDADLETGATSAVFRYIILAALNFPSGMVRIHNGVGTHSFGGNDYLGVGTFGSVDAITDTTSLISKPVKLSLSSINQEIIDAIKTDDILGADADLYLGSLNEGYQLQGTPTNWFSGHMEIPELALGEKDGVVITLQSRASRLKLRNNKRYTIEDHQADYPGDLFLEFLPSVQEAQVNWGGEQVRTGFQNTGPGTGPGTQDPGEERDIKF